jgi:uncharacterized membrane protein YfcA
MAREYSSRRGLDYDAPMPDAAGLVVLIATALVASVVAGVAGFGAGIILLPVVAWVVGVRAAAPVLTVTMLLANLARLWWSRHELDGRAAGRYLLGAVPATLLGVTIYAGTPSEWLGRAIGAFLIAAVPLRRVLFWGHVRVRPVHLPFLGGVFGLLSALVVTTGPITAPFFLAYGLRRGSFIATEAVCALGMHVTRIAAFARYALLGWDTVALGCILGTTMFAGAWAGRRLLDRMSDRVFLAILEALTLVAGLHMLLFSR